MTATEEAAVKFMLLTYRDPNVQLTPVGAWCDEMDGRGVRLTGHVLAPPSETRTIQLCGRALVGRREEAEL